MKYRPGAAACVRAPQAKGKPERSSTPRWPTSDSSPRRYSVAAMTASTVRRRCGFTAPVIASAPSKATSAPSIHSLPAFSAAQQHAEELRRDAAHAAPQDVGWRAHGDVDACGAALREIDRDLRAARPGQSGTQGEWLYPVATTTLRVRSGPSEVSSR